MPIVALGSERGSDHDGVGSSAATFLHTALRLRPFTDYNASIGVACVGAYTDGSGIPIDPQPGDWAKLVADIRGDEVDLTEAARLLRDWAV